MKTYFTVLMVGFRLKSIKYFSNIVKMQMTYLQVDKFFPDITNYIFTSKMSTVK